jgi:tRNA(Arg) A34 adenosine deaminase TadA
MADARSPIDLMQQCLVQAAQNAASGRGGPFAALVVRDGRVIASGANGVVSQNDPTAHAEIQAIRAAARSLATFKLVGCELLASCEPCPMCLGAIYWARLERVYFAATRLDAAAAGFDDARVYEEFGLPPSQRTVPLEQIAVAEAKAPFEAWNRNPHRVSY